MSGPSMMEQILDVTVRQVSADTRILEAAGEIDHDSCGDLRQAISRALADGCHRLVLDLTQVTFCDSGGLSTFVDAHRRTTAEGGWFRLAAPRRLVRDVLTATNLDGYLVVRDTVDDALTAGS
ncbi:STAS domain-containing protein [Plantactinospora sp. GCM10030261]|uniref:STAS domain-containing protein n=1 Tax=Plantactinospora sp. GCM10030261 TaxID=3273420 RepID=UPI00361672C3